MESTRPIIAFDRVTADGYFAGPDGNLNWVVPEEELDKSAADSLGGSDTILFGRRTYEMFESFWPKALEQPATPNPHGGPQSPAMHAMAVWINDAKKVVFSKSLKTVTWKNTRLVHECDPREIEAMKRAPGKAMMIFGSGSIVSLLTQHGLIDEYHFIVGPILIGSGKSLISGVTKHVKLDLQEARAFPSGNVRLRYARAK